MTPIRILVRGVNWLGDAVMSTPALLRLRQRHPAAFIALLTPSKLAELWQGHPALTRALLALCSRQETPADWFVAGQAMQRVLLRAAAGGLAASFFSQAVEVPTVRARLRETLGELGWPQLLFRLGYGRPVRPTPRRPVELVLRSLASAAPPQAAIVRPAAGVGF